MFQRLTTLMMTFAVASAGARAKAGSSVFNEEAARDEGRRIRHKMLSLNAYDRHKILVNTYLINRYYALIETSFSAELNYHFMQFRTLMQMSFGLSFQAWGCCSHPFQGHIKRSH